MLLMTSLNLEVESANVASKDWDFFALFDGSKC